MGGRADRDRRAQGELLHRPVRVVAEILSAATHSGAKAVNGEAKAPPGTDHPYITLERWRRDFDALDIDPAVLPMILKDNALAVLGVSRTDR